MSDNAIEIVVNIERQFLGPYPEWLAPRDVVVGTPEQRNGCDKKLSRLRGEALDTIDDNNYLISYYNLVSSDNTCFIRRLAIGFTGKIRADEEAVLQFLLRPVRDYSTRFSTKDMMRNEN